MDVTRSPASGCPVLSYSPHERRPIGEWAAFFDQLRADAPVVRNTFADGYYVLTRYEDIGALDDRIRGWAAELIDALATRGECDVIADFSFYYPTTIFLGLMGLPPEHLPRFMAWESNILHSNGSTPEEIEHNRMTAITAVSGCFRSVIAERRAPTACRWPPRAVTARPAASCGT